MQNKDSGKVGRTPLPQVEGTLQAAEVDGLPGLDAFARTIVKHISDAALELAFIRHSLTSDEFDEEDYPDIGGSRQREQAREQWWEEIKEDTLACITGDESGCLDPEDLDETNCELIWLKAQLTQSAEGGNNPTDTVANSVPHLPESVSAPNAKLRELLDNLDAEYAGRSQHGDLVGNIKAAIHYALLFLGNWPTLSRELRIHVSAPPVVDSREYQRGVKDAAQVCYAFMQEFGPQAEGSVAQECGDRISALVAPSATIVSTNTKPLSTPTVCSIGRHLEGCSCRD